MIIDIIDRVKKTQTTENNPWDNSPFKTLLTLSIDGRGKVGEEMVSQAFHAVLCDIQEDITDVNDGSKYDIKVNNHTIEIKTAYRDIRNSWQHENIYKNANVDYIIFIDFDYQDVIISCVPTNIITFEEKDKIFGKKATLRKAKDDGYKFDFSRRTHKNLINNNLAKVFSEAVTKEELGEWLINMI